MAQATDRLLISTKLSLIHKCQTYVTVFCFFVFISFSQLSATGNTMLEGLCTFIKNKKKSYFKIQEKIYLNFTSVPFWSVRLLRAIHIALLVKKKKKTRILKYDVITLLYLYV